MTTPKKWHEVYPYGTKEGDEEAKVFRSLSRHSKFEYRSTGAIIKATGLPRERVEEIIDKYAEQIDPPLIYPHPNQDDHWGYWERCGLPKTSKKSISGQDQQNRIDKHLVTTPDMVVSKGDDAVAAEWVCDL